MKRIVVMVMAALLGCVLAACGYSPHVTEIYVITPPQKASEFIKDLAAVMQRHGFVPNPGQATDDKGHTLYVLEAKSRWLRLWGENLPLSGLESAAECGEYNEGHPDPGQYVVSLDRRFPMIAEDEPRRLLPLIGNELRALGYEVRQEPVVCSSLSKMASTRAN
jgi:hypothetical protein